MRPKYPDVHVKWWGDRDDRAGIAVKTTRAMRREGVPNEEIDAYWAEIDTGGDPYEITRKWVDFP